MPSPLRGDVWLADLGMAAKVRPALILSVPPEPQDRVLVTLVPHTTSIHDSKSPSLRIRRVGTTVVSPCASNAPALRNFLGTTTSNRVRN
jgi:mRNA-degrading endonuclease toxin of MazEF toxin-antitoxin module